MGPPPHSKNRPFPPPPQHARPQSPLPRRLHLAQLPQPGSQLLHAPHPPAHHDRTNFEIFCYSDVAIPDSITKRFQGYAKEWQDATSLSDEQLAKQIRGDRIDILVELTGHLGKGRLISLAYRPAPVQISYIGYQGTTGVSAVDYVLTDDWADPTRKNPNKTTSKNPSRLPSSFFVYEPPGSGPRGSPPARQLRRLRNLRLPQRHLQSNPRAVALWARILSAVPNSKMILSSTKFEETNRRILNQFNTAGISPDRIQLLRMLLPPGIHARYNTIDIALDPSPFNGHTTTCDAAWMGCPTVTLSGQIYAHRYGGSVLRNLDLPDLATESEEAYITAAVNLANDLTRLANIRSTLRFTMQKSLITDGPKFTRNLEHAYREMWRIWCAGGVTADS